MCLGMMKTSPPCTQVETYFRYEGRSYAVTGQVDWGAHTPGDHWHNHVDIDRIVDEETGAEVRLDKCGQHAARDAVANAGTELWGRE